MNAKDITYRVLEEVGAERERQDAKMGEQNWPDGTGGEAREVYAMISRELTNARDADGTLTWTDILDEEFAEALAEIDEQKLRTELVQVAAVAVAWVEAIDRRIRSRVQAAA